MDQVLSVRHRVVHLVDAYGRLLTAHQQRLLRLYYLDDLSLGEIAERLHVTRQAVYDGLRRSLRELERIDVSLDLVRVRHQAAQRRRRVRAHLDTLELAVAQLGGRVEGNGLRRVRTALTALRRALGYDRET